MWYLGVSVWKENPSHYRPQASVGSKKGIPSLAAARLQHWTILLSAYEYEIKFKAAHDHANADGLSCLPLVDTPKMRERESFASFFLQLSIIAFTGSERAWCKSNWLLTAIWEDVRDHSCNTVSRGISCKGRECRGIMEQHTGRWEGFFGLLESLKTFLYPCPGLGTLEKAVEGMNEGCQIGDEFSIVIE